jgi:alkanesulfonate monooxygenase SsuD/methylene tetrahydromethanopterin reductase-like flavin-dependent oxidoreductase (luciferase family)
MKFHWFHLMPYPNLPEDFRDRYRGVWVDAPARELFDPVLGHELYHEYLDELEYADELGFDGICVNEHHQNAYGMMPSPNLMAATLARVTKRAKIVVMGNSVALYNPPIRVAEELAMIDVLSGGRLVAGFPVGTPMDTTFAYGANPVTLREKYREGVELILRAWKSDRPFAFNGKYTQLRYVNPWPLPLQQPHPPVWIPGSGGAETWQWCIDNDFLFANLSYHGFMRAKQTLEGFWETVDKAGAEMNPYRAGFLQFVAIADSDAEAERLYADHARYFYNRCLYFYPGFTNPPGFVTQETLRRGIRSQVQAAAAQRANLTWREIVDLGYIVAGSAETVIDKLNEMADVLRVGHLMVLCQFGDMRRETAMENTRRFAKDVAPALRGRFSEWEDRWWPAERAAAPVGSGAGAEVDK